MITRVTPKINARTLLDPNNVPRQLWPYKQFVCWKYVDRGPDRKPDKVPVNPKTLGNAGATWPNSWGTIRDCVATYRTHDDLAGIGYVLTPHDPFVMIDLDNCVVAGNLSPFASEIVERLPIYWEFSPSLRGLRGFVHCEQQPDALKREEIEVYSTGRFATLTGNVLHQKPIVKIESLSWLAERFAPKAQQQQTHISLSPHVAVSQDDQGLWERLKHFHPWIGPVYDGNLSGIQGQDYSRAVILLLNQLARWTQGDAARMDRLIRQTQLDPVWFDQKRGKYTWLEARITDAICRYSGKPKPWVTR